MSWLAIPVGVFLGALVQSPWFWIVVLLGLMGWRAYRKVQP